jgi:hypothetical protein
MRFKKWIFLLAIIFLSGCTAKYNLNIDSNLIVSEEIELNESNRILNTYTIDINRYIEENIEEIVEREGYDNYFFSKDIGSSYSSVTGKATYLDLENFNRNNKIKDYFFTDMIYSNVSGVVNLKFIAKNRIEVLEDAGIYNALIDEAEVTITLPFKVIENNADEVDDITNSYTWIYKKNKINKNIELIFDTSKNAVKPVPKTTYILIGIIVVVLSIGLYVYYSYKKNSVL